MIDVCVLYDDECESGSGSQFNAVYLLICVPESVCECVRAS